MIDGMSTASGETTETFAPPLHPYTELLPSSVQEMDSERLDGTLVSRKAIAAAAGKVTGSAA